MRKGIVRLIVGLWLSLCPVMWGFAIEPIRVLFVDRGHDYDEPAFCAMLESFGDELAIERAHLPEDQSLLAPELARTTDVILFYDQDQTPLSDKAKADLESLYQTGIGVFSLHHHLSSHPEWPDYWRFAGGCYVFESNRRINGRELPLGDFHHDQVIDVTVVTPDHPILEGVGDFTIEDETYENLFVSPDVETLLVTDHPLSTREIAWVKTTGKSPVFTLTLGHDAKAYNNPNFRRLVIQGIRWLSQESKKARGEEQEEER